MSWLREHRRGISISVALHIALFLFGIALAKAEKPKEPEALLIDLISATGAAAPGDRENEMQSGRATLPSSEVPKRAPERLRLSQAEVARLNRILARASEVPVLPPKPVLPETSAPKPDAPHLAAPQPSPALVNDEVLKPNALSSPSASPNLQPKEGGDGQGMAATGNGDGAQDEGSKNGKGGGGDGVDRDAESFVPVTSQSEKYRGYLSLIRDRINNVWRDPRKKSEERRGRIEIEFEIAKSGDLLSMHVQNTAGEKDLREAAASAIQDAAPYPRIPDTIRKKKPLKLTMVFHYQLERAGL